MRLHPLVQAWLKLSTTTRLAEYLRSSDSVSSCVLNEFMSTSGTSQS